MAMVVYRGNRDSFVPPQYRAALNAATTVASAVSYITSTDWYRRKSAQAKQSIVSGVRSLFSGGRARAPVQPMPMQLESAPVAVNRRTTLRAPRYRGGNINGGIRVTHREYLSEIYANQSFGVSVFPVNPGMTTGFPWLSSLANAFEKYKVHKLKYDFVNVSATSERGRVTLAFDYDALDEDPTSKVDVFQFEGAAEGSVWSTLQLPVKTNPKELYTRMGAVSGDLKTYDFGKVVVGVSNTSLASTEVVGELFVEYEIELITPQPTKCPGNEYATTGITGTDQWLGSSPAPTVISNGIPVDLVASGIRFKRSGKYLLTTYLTEPTTNLGVVTYNFSSASVSDIITVYNTAGDKIQTSCEITVTAPDQVVFLQTQNPAATAGTSQVKLAYFNVVA